MPWWKKLLWGFAVVLAGMIFTGNGPAAADIVQNCLEAIKDGFVGLGEFAKSVFNE